MKTLINTLIVSTALVTGASAFANTDAQQLSACKARIMHEYGDIERIKVSHINSKPKVFKAKLKVRANGEKSLYHCQIPKGDAAVVSCLKGACKAEDVAAQ